MSDFELEPSRCAVLVVDLQNDNLAEGGASDGTEAFHHAKEQNVVENAGKISSAARQAGAQVVHCHFVVEPEADYSGRNIKLFRMIADDQMVVGGKWGALPVEGARDEPRAFQRLLHAPARRVGNRSPWRCGGIGRAQPRRSHCRAAIRQKMRRGPREGTPLDQSRCQRCADDDLRSALRNERCARGRELFRRTPAGIASGHG